MFVPVIHTDKDSVERARDAVRSIEPDIVAVELDRERYRQLTEVKPEDQKLVQTPTGNAVQDLMQNLAILEQNLGEITGSAVGEEMLAAIEEGRKIGSKIALVDRPLHLTMQALMSVPLDELYRLMGLVPGAAEEIRESDANDIFSMLKSDGGVEELMKDFENQFPNTADALIHQRDRYVANALVSILGDVEGKVVVVLGAGHIDGVKRALGKLLSQESAS
ncbi:MAG: TraB/GumN family protein [Promethearchaeota archaeon]